MDSWILTVNAVMPVFFITFLGMLLRKIGFLDDDFDHHATRLVFHVALPVLVFLKLSSTDFSLVFHPGQIAYACLLTVVVFGLLWLIAARNIKSGRDLGTFLQCSIRSNFAIVGFAIILNRFGEAGLAKASILLAFIMPLYNMLAVIALTVPLHHQKQMHFRKTLVHIITNPLILAAAAAFLVSLCRIQIPRFLLRTGDYLSALALPLALLAVGGSLNTKAFRKASSLAVCAVLIKLIVIPVAGTAGAVILGWRGQDLGILFLLFAAPSAIASFVMAKTMGGNGKLAGNIVFITTFGACFTITAGLGILAFMGWI